MCNMVGIFFNVCCGFSQAVQCFSDDRVFNFYTHWSVFILHMLLLILYSVGAYRNGINGKPWLHQEGENRYRK